MQHPRPWMLTVIDRSRLSRRTLLLLVCDGGAAAWQTIVDAMESWGSHKMCVVPVLPVLSVPRTAQSREVVWPLDRCARAPVFLAMTPPTIHTRAGTACCTHTVRCGDRARRTYQSRR